MGDNRSSGRTEPDVSEWKYGPRGRPDALRVPEEPELGVSSHEISRCYSACSQPCSAAGPVCLCSRASWASSRSLAASRDLPFVLGFPRQRMHPVFQAVSPGPGEGFLGRVSS